MSTAEVSSSNATDKAIPAKMDMKFEIVAIVIGGDSPKVTCDLP